MDKIIYKKTILVISIAIFLMGSSILIFTNTATAGVDSNDLIPCDFDDDTSSFFRSTKAVPTGDDYILYEHHGGTWYDAEKTNIDTDDNLMCWAAAASNVLRWTGWGLVIHSTEGAMTTEDDMFEHFNDHWEDQGGLSNIGFQWWFNGTVPGDYPNDPPYGGGPPSWSEIDVAGGGDFWYPPYKWNDYVHADYDTSDEMGLIDTWLRNGWGVALGIYGPGGHAITCWGFNYDPTVDKSTNPEDYYIGVWVTDSDDDKNNDPHYPDSIRYYEVAYTGGKWHLQDYYGTNNWYIDYVFALEPFPNTAPTADANGPYTGNEGSLITLDGSGSSDPDNNPLRYRWDFTNDGSWDTGWSTNPTITHTYADGFSGQVRLQVSDYMDSDIDTASITINNVAPSITSITGDTINENDFATVSVTFTDPSTLDTYNLNFNWGDGEAPSLVSVGAGTGPFTVSATHQYEDDNPTDTSYDIYSVQVTVSDDDGGSDTDSTTVQVNNVAPTVTVVSPNGGEAWSGTHDIVWTVTDPGTQDTFIADLYYSADNGGNWIPINTVGCSHGMNTYSWDTTSYPESDQALIRVEVTDDDLGMGVDTSDTVFIVDNTPPVTTKLIDGFTSGVDDLYVDIPNEFSFDAYDALSGVDHTYYRIQFNGVWTPVPGSGVGISNDFMYYTTPFSLDEEGIYFIEFYSDDVAGNEEDIHSQKHIVLDWWAQYHKDTSNTGCSVSHIPNYPFVAWKTSLHAKIMSSPAAFYAEHLYVGTMDGTVYCLNAADGTIIWSYHTNGFIRSSPAVADNKVYIGSADYHLYCLDAATGTLLWSYKTGYPIYSSPTVFEDKVYIGSNDGKLYCINATTGLEQWSVSTGCFIHTTPVVVDDSVYVASGNTYVYCYQKDTGVLLWQYLTGGAILASPTVSDGYVYVGSTNGHLYCLQATTGALLWDYATFGAVISSPAVCDSSVYVCSAGGQISCLQKDTGVKDWESFIGHCSFSSPAIASGKLVVGTADGFVYCVDINDGDIIWHAIMGAAVYSSPAVFNSSVYIGCDNGYLYCFREQHDQPILIENIHTNPAVVDLGNPVYIQCDVYGHDITLVTVEVMSPSCYTVNETMTLHPDSNYQYMHPCNEEGVYSYKIWATDAAGHRIYSLTHTFIVHTGDNMVPLAVKDDYPMMKNEILHVDGSGVLHNDNDPDGGPIALTCELVTDVSRGTVSLYEDGSFTYYPENEFTGEEEFSYRVFDGLDYSESVTVTLQIAAEAEYTGDMNDDGVMNAGDVRYLAMHLCGTPGYESLFDSGDVNGDGQVNAGDVRYIAMHLCGDPLYSVLYPKNVV